MEAIIFVGIQGSGKSTFYRQRFFETHVRVSLDLVRTRERERVFLRACLSTGQRFVVDNTNVLASERAVYIAVAKEAGFRTVCYFFRTPLRQAMARNLKRKGKQAIPPQGVAGAYKRLQPPRRGEGFDEIFSVMLTPEDEFVVDAWTETEASVPAQPRPQGA